MNRSCPNCGRKLVGAENFREAFIERAKNSEENILEWISDELREELRESYEGQKLEGESFEEYALKVLWADFIELS